MLDNLELVLLTFDEVVDGGYDFYIVFMYILYIVNSIIMETDPLSISNRVTMKVNFKCLVALNHYVIRAWTAKRQCKS